MSRLDLPAQLPRTTRLIQAGIEAGWHPGVQVCVRFKGEVLVDDAIGTAAPGVPMTADSLVPWMSAGKPITAAAILQREERGELHCDQAVADHIPEFAANGKEQVTIEQLLTHTAGLQPVETGWPEADWNEIMERIYRSRLRHGWDAGEQAAYDPQRSWFVLGEILQRLGGAGCEEIIRESVCVPLGMRDSWLTWTTSRSEEYGARLARMHLRGKDACLPLSRPKRDNVTASPGGSFFGPVRELARFYEMLLQQGELEGARLLRPETVSRMRERRRTGRKDLSFQHVIDFGLGLMLDSNRYGVETVPYGFGRHCSPETFGHGGAQSSIAFADPVYGLVVVIAANGMPGEATHQQRHRDLCSAVYEDLGLA